jgi:tetratricopeptide (TPR) repeat protein
MSSQSNEGPDEVLERLYMGAMAAAKAGRLEEAAEMLDQMMTLDPNFPDAWWNLGTFRAQLNQHGPALSVWDIYRGMVPDDWRARPKVIQSCQALGDTARRDRERDELLALRRAGTDPALAAEPHYCREQFRVGGRPVVAYEVFEPADPQRVFYTFLVGEPDGRMIGRYSLGSYEATTEISRELGRIGPEERIYHLDWYDPQGHRTFGFFSRLPSYDEARAQVVAAMTGSLSAVSGITTSPGTGKADIYLNQDAPATTQTSMAHEMGVLAYGGDSPPPPSAPPPPARPDATRVRVNIGRGSQAGLGERVSSWIARLLGRRDDRAN